MLSLALSYVSKKLESKSTPCIFLGYSLTQSAYRCRNPHSKNLFTSRHVIFVETIFPFSSHISPDSLTSWLPTVFHFKTPSPLPNPTPQDHTQPAPQLVAIRAPEPISPVRSPAPLPLTRSHQPITTFAPQQNIHLPNLTFIPATSSTDSLRSRPLLPLPPQAPQTRTNHILLYSLPSTLAKCKPVPEIIFSSLTLNTPSTP